MVEAYVPGVGRIDDVSAYLAERLQNKIELPNTVEELKLLCHQLESQIKKLEQSNAEIQEYISNEPDEVMVESYEINLQAIKTKEQRLEKCKQKIAVTTASPAPSPAE